MFQIFPNNLRPYNILSIYAKVYVIETYWQPCKQFDFFPIVSQILWVLNILHNVKFTILSFSFSQSHSELLDNFRLSGLRWIWEILLFFLLVMYHFYIVCFAHRMYFTMALVTNICKLKWRDRIMAWMQHMFNLSHTRDDLILLCLLNSVNGVYLNGQGGTPLCLSFYEKYQNDK